MSDCKICSYKYLNTSSGGWCYMFRDEVINCKQLKPIKLNKCSVCGFQPIITDGDCLYPMNREHTLWSVNCFEVGGGCGTYALGINPEQAILNWNRQLNLQFPD